MNFLLDTNVVSEAMKPRPDENVVQWLLSHDEDRLYLSAVSLAELHQGVQRLAQGARRHRLERWVVHELPERFQGRILPVEERIAESWGRIVAMREAGGRPISTIDGFLAATARVHELTVVTRNEADFRDTVPLVNPWN